MKGSSSFLFLLIGISVLPKIDFAQNKLNTAGIGSVRGKGWNVSLEEIHKVFIENKGQFDGKSLSPSFSGEEREKMLRILYGVNNNGVDIYFTPIGHYIQA